MRLDQLFPISQEITIRLPDGEKGWTDGTVTDIKLKLITTDSKAFHAIATRQAQAEIGKEGDFTVSEMQQRTAERVAACIVGWSGLEDASGAVPYSHEKATELMLTPELSFVREQVEGFAVKRSHFFRQGADAA